MGRGGTNADLEDVENAQEHGLKLSHLGLFPRRKATGAAWIATARAAGQATPLGRAEEMLAPPKEGIPAHFKRKIMHFASTIQHLA